MGRLYAGAMSKKLTDLPFIDLYLCIEGNAKPHYKVTGKDQAAHPNIMIPADYETDVKSLAEYIRKNVTEEWAMLEYDGMRLRAVFVPTSNKQKWVALRRIKDLPPAFSTLGFPPLLVQQLRDLGRSDGLILVCGATGQGKTTTCCSLLLDYMKRYGGVAFTIEDPVEYALGGQHGDKGYCFQVEVHEDEEWEEMLRRSLRCHPQYIFIGEVLTPGVANQLLRAATSGHTVIATVHAGSPQEGLEGLLQLAEQKIGDRAKQLLSSSLLALVHQSIDSRGLNVRFVVTGGASQSAAIRTLIRENRIGQLNSVIDQQLAQMQGGGIRQESSKNPEAKT
jgi:twitching motility protein PilT